MAVDLVMAVDLNVLSSFIMNWISDNMNGTFIVYIKRSGLLKRESSMRSRRSHTISKLTKNIARYFEKVTLIQYHINQCMALQVQFEKVTFIGLTTFTSICICSILQSDSIFLSVHAELYYH